MSRILITSALPYVNGIKHLGNLAGSMLPADVYARFQRARRGAENVLYICATDEHGTPAELAALEEGLPIADYAAKYHRIQKSIYDGFQLSFDYFGRSSSPQNHALTQEFARTLWAGGHLDVRTTRQVYSNADKRFLPDRYVIGTCPHCGYDRARGDQCENCTRVLDPVDLIEPRSALSGSPDIEIKDTSHLFLKQSAFAGEIRTWIEGKKSEWGTVVTSIALKWLDEGLRDRGITRDLEWGVPVPDDIADGKLKGKVFYVWFDAPIEYIGATREWADAKGDPTAWERWWRAPDNADVRYVEFMGKDNVPFHTVGFPVTILGSNKSSNRPWKLVDEIKGFNWLNYYGGKFSTSQKRGIFMDQALEILPADYWRYYLIANAPESADSSFTWEHFAATVNKDLADVLGNFVNRVLKFATARFGSTVPAEGKDGPTEQDLAIRLERLIGLYTVQLEEMQFRKAAQELRAIWVAANEYVAVAAPWTTIKTDPAASAASIRTAINLIGLIAVLSAPIIPQTASALAEAVGLDPNKLIWPTGKAADELRKIKAGQAFTVPPVLFGKLLPDQVEAYEARFGGDS
ncbi:Methionine--tRNA ligase [Alphaproteobacteria bacterium SO-S41]|nr:Methionine--tRNA ligase [Alphaproteobacteria bacterium SO-S41]